MKKKQKHLFPFLSILTQSQLDRTRRAYVVGPDFKIVDILFPPPSFFYEPFSFFFSFLVTVVLVFVLSSVEV